MKNKLLNFVLFNFLAISLATLFTQTSKNKVDATDELNGAFISNAYGSVTYDRGTYFYDLNDPYSLKESDYKYGACECFLPKTDYTLNKSNVFIMDNPVGAYAFGLNKEDKTYFTDTKHSPYEDAVSGQFTLICTLNSDILNMKLFNPYGETIEKNISDKDIIEGDSSASFFYRQTEEKIGVSVRFAFDGAYVDKTSTGTPTVEKIGGMYKYSQNASYNPCTKAYLPLVDYSSTISSKHYALFNLESYNPSLTDSTPDGTGASVKGLFNLEVTNNGVNDLTVTLKRDGITDESKNFSSEAIYNGYQSISFSIRNTETTSGYLLVDLDELESIESFMSLGYQYDKNGDSIVNDNFRLKVGVDAKFISFAGTFDYTLDVTCGGKTINCSPLHLDSTNNVNYLIIDLGAAYTNGHMNDVFTVQGFIKIQYGTGSEFSRLSCASKSYSISGMIDYYYSLPEYKSAVSDLYNIIH